MIAAVSEELSALAAGETTKKKKKRGLTRTATVIPRSVVGLDLPIVVQTEPVEVDITLEGKIVVERTTEGSNVTEKIEVDERIEIVQSVSELESHQIENQTGDSNGNPASRDDSLYIKLMMKREGKKDLIWLYKTHKF